MFKGIVVSEGKGSKSGKFGVYLVVSGNRILGGGDEWFKTKTEAMEFARSLDVKEVETYCKGRVGRFMGSEWIKTTIVVLMNELKKSKKVVS